MNRPADPDRPFEAPWHAELFAVTHALARAGAFDWTDWADWFGTALAQADAEGAPKDGSTYYEVWLSAFETFLRARDLAGDEALATIREAWRTAYLTTPHGEPVAISS